MEWFNHRRGFTFVLMAIGAMTTAPATPSLQAVPTTTRPDIGVEWILDLPGDGRPVRLVKDPTTEILYALKSNGDLNRVDLESRTATLTATRADHGVAEASGLAIGGDGTVYVVGYQDISDTETIGFVQRGIRSAEGITTWSRLVTSEPYGKSFSIFNHRWNGVVVDPDGDYLYLNSGSRTDHGEIQNSGGFFPAETREMGLTTIILKVPVTAAHLTLPNDREALRAGGFLHAEGVRNTYDLAFAPSGHLFGTENSPDLDLPEELNWLVAGRHFGFPWRIGGQDNPQQFPDYDPASDFLLNPQYNAVKSGYYHNDPTFPPPPADMMEPVTNLGPHADKFRDPVDGSVKDASDLGIPLATFTAHRSPLGLSFDRNRALSPEFRGDGFVLSWTPGYPNSTTENGPFLDPSQDLLHLDLRQHGENYVARVTRLVGGFSNPIDSEMIGSQLYVLEYGGDQSIWKISLPTETPVSTVLRATAIQSPDRELMLKVENFAAGEIKVLESADFRDWFGVEIRTVTADDMAAGSVTLPIASDPGAGPRFFLVINSSP